MEDFLQKFSVFFFRRFRIVRWWFNLSLATKLVIAFAINASVTIAFGGIIYYLVQSGKDFQEHLGFLLGAVCIASVVILLYGMYIAFLTSTPLLKSVGFAKTIADGDLTPSLSCLSQKDEVGQLCASLNTMVESFRILVGNLSQGADVFGESSKHLVSLAGITSQSAEQITSAMNQVASGSQAQSNSVQAILLTVEEMLRIVKQIEQRVGQADQASSHALQAAEEGEKEIARTSRQMVSIQARVNETSGIIQELGEKSTHIGIILETIKGISDQTNLLALNAAIEAARAGEHGRGFSVVAEEVRKLAEQSNASSTEIEKIIQEIKNCVTMAMNSMEAENFVVGEGTKVIRESQEAFARITKNTRIVNTKIQEVIDLTRNIILNTQEITNEINQVACVVEETTAQSEEVASSSSSQLESMQEINAAAEELSKAADELQTAVKKFTVA